MAKHNREESLERLIQRLGKRLDRLQMLDNRFSVLRLVVFSLGVIAVYLASALGTPVMARVTGGIAILAFILIVTLHRRLDRWRAKFSLWRGLRQNELARMTLDWKRLPASPIRVSTEYCSPLAIDLDLTGPRSIHHLLDLAVSEEGSQRLADWLCQGKPNLEHIQERQTLVRELAGLRRFRDRLLLNLHLVSTEQLKGKNLLNWLTNPVPTARLTLLLVLGSVLVGVNLILFILNTTGVIDAFWPITSLMYIAFLSTNAGRLRPFLDTILELDAELDKFASLLGYLEKYPYKHAPNLAKLCAVFRNPADLPTQRLRQIKWVTAMVGLRSNVITWLLMNLILPWDFLCAVLAKRLRNRAAVLFPTWLETWYQLEALCSLANFAYINPDYAFPEIQAEADPIFSSKDMGHPLIPATQRVCNDFTIREQGDVVILTGSNMAGKSTFIKTIGLNLCLAYSGGPVCAGLLRCQPVQLHTCIRISDSIPDGFSYFYAEVKCLKQLLEAMGNKDDWPVLYLIDEIFRGTNNRERLLGSQAYTQVLIGAHGCGLIATHDLELAKLAEQSQQVSNFHFRDAVQDGKLVFDYKIQPGPCPTTNALKIMRMEGLPVPTEASEDPKA